MALMVFTGIADEDLTQQQVDDILDGFGVRRVIFGHTKDNTIRSLYEGRVLAIDMYHVDNFENGFMEALQFELGCFYLFHTTELNQTYTQLGDCDEFLSALELNGVNQIQLYPNPSGNYLNIKLPEYMGQAYQYSIVDNQGKQVASGNMNGELAMIEIGHLAAGNYRLTLTNSVNTITGQFILKN
jgi:Secretion system C-terminal sorting domain